ncbi:MAG: cytochrome B6-F complex subunit VI [Cyanobacteria bacterium QS_8_64_29]|jgi:hypothetical protein|nr:MAG: cytochrome B6-F complex subunit VI [Cyanobacteria bacterium QS_8_64_29]
MAAVATFLGIAAGLTAIAMGSYFALRAAKMI